MDYDLATLLNSAQGVLIGVGFAVVIFRLLTLRPGWLTRTPAGRHLRRTSAASPGARWLGGELVRRAHGRPPVAPWRGTPTCCRSRSGGVGTMASLALDLGNELIHLPGLPGRRPWRPAQARDRFLGELGELLEAGPAGPRSDRLERISLPLREALERERSPRRRSQPPGARAALAQLLFTWQQWCHQEESHESA
ncbi:FUSC family protein [Pseudomonas aeruginosa]|nr:FUSC family protein [Pseudomonas aeruginosa]